MTLQEISDSSDDDETDMISLLEDAIDIQKHYAMQR